jgi:hypothetical protein
LLLLGFFEADQRAAALPGCTPAAARTPLVHRTFEDGAFYSAPMKDQ